MQQKGLMHQGRHLDEGRNANFSGTGGRAGQFLIMVLSTVYPTGTVSSELN